MKMRRKGDLPVKTCAVCGRPMVWRKAWEKVWDEVKYCSDRCRGQREKDAAQPPLAGTGPAPPQGTRQKPNVRKARAQD